MIERFPIDWPVYGYDDCELNELVEQLLRMIQSFVVSRARHRAVGTPYVNT